MTTISQLLREGDLDFLETEVLLANTLNVTRSYLHAHGEQKLTLDECLRFQSDIKQRKQGRPTAYLTGQKEFWSLNLRVTQDTLIPRPETERLVEIALDYAHFKKNPITLADLGTGAGSIALALAYEHPEWEIYATDISDAALKVAIYNARSLKLNHIIFKKGSWFAALPKMQFDFILSNPPYIAPDDDTTLARLIYEPYSALVSLANGLAAIQTLIINAVPYLKSSGYLMLEHGFDQAQKVQNVFAEVGYNDVKTFKDLAGNDRVTVGQMRSQGLIV